MKHSLTLLSVAMLCVSTAAICGGTATYANFGSASYAEEAPNRAFSEPFNLTVENKTQDTANVVAVYRDNKETPQGSVTVKEKQKTFSIPSDKLKKVIITAGLNTKTITDFKEPKTIPLP